MDYCVPLLDRDLEPLLQLQVDRKTKPIGALGQLESLAVQIGLIQQRCDPKLNKPIVLVFAGDHGAAKAGVSAYPQDVTWQMVENFLVGGAAINVFCRQNDLALAVIDAGVAHDFGARDGLIDAKIAFGTLSYLNGPAMSPEQCELAIRRGAEIVRAHTEHGSNVIGFGEMGIGNTASASLITHCLTGTSLADCIGRGTGLDDAGLNRKTELLSVALSTVDRGKLAEQPLSVLQQFGGFEIAMMVGAMLEAARQRCVLLIDGFIVGAAALVAGRLAPSLLEYCVFCHRSAEPGHRAQLTAMHAQPLLDLGLRLGEGTGVALAYPLVKAAGAFLNDMASFEAAGVSEKVQ